MAPAGRGGSGAAAHHFRTGGGGKITRGAGRGVLLSKAGCRMAGQMSATASAPSAPSKELSEFARLSGIIWEPSATFRDIAARPRWWPPLVVVIALSLVFSSIFTQRGGW